MEGVICMWYWVTSKYTDKFKLCAIDRRTSLSPFNVNNIGAKSEFSLDHEVSVWSYWVTGYVFYTVQKLSLWVKSNTGHILPNCCILLTFNDKPQTPLKKISEKHNI